MKKTAIVVLLSSLFFAGMFLPGAEQADHSGSPAYSASLERAINMLEGAAVEVTAAAAMPEGDGEPMRVTYDCETFDETCEYYETCQPGNPNCGHTSENTCEVTYDTCDPTFDDQYTCELYSTCEFTCELYPGCEPTGDLICQPTVDTETCDPSVPTCEDTCVGLPGCPSSASERTSWGAIKEMF